MTALAILCPGQGSQHPGMFELVADDPAAAAVWSAATTAFGWDPRERVRRGERLFDNAIAQPLVCSAILADWAALRPRLPQPLLFAGYSVGELAAYGCADGLSVAETLRLARQRAQFMDQAGTQPAGLLALRGLVRSQVEALCRTHGAAIAIVNGAEHFIVGGLDAALNAMETAARALGANVPRRLPVTVAAHTPLLLTASERFREALAASALVDPKVPVLAGISAAPVRERAAAVATLAAQLAAPLDWAACMQAAWEAGARVFLEIGPGTALARLVRDALPGAAVRALEEFRTLTGVADWVERGLA